MPFPGQTVMTLTLVLIIPLYFVDFWNLHFKNESKRNYVPGLLKKNFKFLVERFFLGEE